MQIRWCGIRGDFHSSLNWHNYVWLSIAYLTYLNRKDFFVKILDKLEWYTVEFRYILYNLWELMNNLQTATNTSCWISGQSNQCAVKTLHIFNIKLFLGVSNKKNQKHCLVFFFKISFYYENTTYRDLGLTLLIGKWSLDLIAIIIAIN